MSTIWKWRLEDGFGHRTITVPAPTELFAAGLQDGSIVVWGIVPEADAPPDDRQLLVTGTGHDFDWSADKAGHLGTVQMGWVVVHVFERGYED